jgi:exodeoxyribonuclease VII large subunit
MLTVLKRRFENISVLLYPVKVQGDGAREEIAGGITYLDQQTDVDVIVVARGGGSLEDLWAFNEEVVARAIEKAGKPIISAVGHEVDFTICDFVSDVRAPTPSAAAEIVVKSKADLLFRIDNSRQRLVTRMRMALKENRGLLRAVNARLKDPRRRMADLRLKGDDLMGRLVRAVHRGLDERQRGLINLQANLSHRAPLTRVERLRDWFGQREKRLETAIRDVLGFKRRSLERSIDRLGAMSPLAILQRGYSIVRKVPDMEILRDANEVGRGDRLDVKLYRGRLICGVEKTETDG